jgi:hypothetical protein
MGKKNYCIRLTDHQVTIIGRFDHTGKGKISSGIDTICAFLDTKYNVRRRKKNNDNVKVSENVIEFDGRKKTGETDII